MAIYTGNIDVPIGKFVVAVDTYEHDAKADILTIVQHDMKCHIGLIRVSALKKSNRRITKSMHPIKYAEDWAWIKKIAS